MPWHVRYGVNSSSTDNIRSTQWPPCFDFVGYQFIWMEIIIVCMTFYEALYRQWMRDWYWPSMVKFWIMYPPLSLRPYLILKLYQNRKNNNKFRVFLIFIADIATQPSSLWYHDYAWMDCVSFGGLLSECTRVWAYFDQTGLIAERHTAMGKLALSHGKKEKDLWLHYKWI